MLLLARCPFQGRVDPADAMHLLATLRATPQRIDAGALATLRDVLNSTVGAGDASVALCNTPERQWLSAVVSSGNSRDLFAGFRAGASVFEMRHLFLSSDLFAYGVDVRSPVLLR
jgi:hypothetical protein